MFRLRHRGILQSVFLACCAAAFFGAAGAFAAPSTNALAWYESFESLTNGFVLDGTNHLYTGTNASAYVVDTTGYDGANSLYIPNEGNFSNKIDNSASIVWADFFVKINARSQAPEVDSTASSQFYFNDSFYAVVQDGPTTNWKTLSTTVGGGAATPVDDTGWHRITVVHNYTNKTWALIVNDQLLDDNINFINTGVAQMSAMSVSNETYLDALLVDTNYPDGSVQSTNNLLAGDVDSDGMPDYWELDYFVYAYVQGGGDDYDGDGRSSTSEYNQNTDPTDPNSYLINLAYRDGFESGTAGSISGTWRGMTIAGTASLQTSDVIEGSKAVSLGEGSANISIAGAQGTNVWVQIYSKPQPFEEVPSGLDSSQVAGFAVMTNGDLLAYDATAWVTCDVVTAVATNEWMGFAVHLDYDNDKYDLYVSTNASFGAHMKRAHSTNFSFNTLASATSLSKIVVTNGSDDATAYVDILAASLAYTNTGIYALTNVVAYDRLAGRFNDASMPPYNYAGGDKLLSGQVGTDLLRELEEGDKLHVFTGSNNVYRINAGSWQKESGAEIATFEISETMGMQIQRFAGVDAVAFYPYSNAVAMSSNIFVSGTNTVGVYDGWNQLASPFSTTRYPNDAVNNYGFSNSVAGDMIFKNNTWIFYNGSKWKKGPADSAMPLQLNDAFWYFHRGTGMLWYVSGE